MREWLADVVVCPVCRGRLGLRPTRFLSYRGTGDRRIAEGVLSCAACREDYPIIGSIPRLVPPKQLTAKERAVAERLARHKGPPEEATAAPPTAEEIRERLEAIIRDQYAAPDEDAAWHRDWLERQSTYLLHYEPERLKHIRTVEPYLEGPIRSVLEVGGGRGGNLGVLMRETGAAHGVAIEILENSCEMALLREPETEIIRADAHALPLADRAFDFVMSAMVLEHLADWRRGALEMARVARQGYIVYTPNGAFIYDHGHLGAPLNAYVPRSLAVTIATAFNRLRRTGRTREGIKQTLDEINVVPRRRLSKLLAAHGVASRPLFERLMHYAVLVEKPYTTPGIKRLLRAHPSLTFFVGRALTLLGVEPVVSLYFRQNEPLRGRSPGRSFGQRV